jgi:hypothetical protein
MSRTQLTFCETTTPHHRYSIPQSLDSKQELSDLPRQQATLSFHCDKGLYQQPSSTQASDDKRQEAFTTISEVSFHGSQSLASVAVSTYLTDHDYKRCRQHLSQSESNSRHGWQRVCTQPSRVICHQAGLRILLEIIQAQQQNPGLWQGR